MLIPSSVYLPLMSGHVTCWNVGLYSINGMHDKFNISTNVCALLDLVIYTFHVKHVCQIKLVMTKIHQLLVYLQHLLHMYSLL